MVTVLRQAMHLSDSDLTRLRDYAQKHAGPIFNPDKRRLQAALRRDSSLVRRLLDVLEKAGQMEGRSLGSVVVLMSQENCKQQTWHTDYDVETVSNVRVKPLGVLLALQDNTFFEEYPDKKHTLHAGDVLMFEGDVVHAGAAYERENVRVHAYVDSNEIKRLPNKTYPFLPPDKSIANI